MKNIIICIGREFGSGGHELAVKAGEALRLPVYDHETLILACRHGDVREETLESEDEKAVNPFLFKTLHEGNVHVRRDLPASAVLHSLETDVIKDLARKHSCIIVGRCADHVLKEEDCTLIRVFVKAPLEHRIARKSRLEDMVPAKAARLVRKMDERRRKYYESYTGRVWGDASEWDVVLDMGSMDMAEAIEQIQALYLQRRES